MSKNFVGRVTEIQQSRDRTWGTALLSSQEAVRGVADTERMHNVDEMAKVVKMADAV